MDYALACSLILFFLHYISHSIMATQIINTSTTFSNNPKFLTVNLVHSSLIVPKHETYNEIENYLLFNEDSVFFINFTLGKPPVPQLAVFDTGSRMVWVSCHPCIACSRTVLPNYNRIRSSTFEKMSCHDPICSQLSTYSCGTELGCLFNAIYASKTNASGFIGTEQMSFQEPDGNEPTILLRQPFGCAINITTKEIKDKKFQGVFGLGFYSGSLLDQFDGKFSYCIGSLDMINIKARVTLGEVENIYREDYLAADLEIEKANWGAYSIPLIDIIAIGGDNDRHGLGIEPHDAVLDTGTENLWLSDDNFWKLRSRVKNIVDKLGLEELFHTGETRLCYGGNMNRDLMIEGILLRVKLRFRYGVHLTLTPRNIFKQETPRYFCLAVSKLDDDIKRVTVIGLRAQQDYNMVYDLKQLQLYFQRADCDNLDVD